MNDEHLVLGGRYRLVEIIGRGGMAQVWRAEDLRLDREVAVKRLRADLATDSTFQTRFNREAQAAAGLNHPNIVAVYDTGAEWDASANADIPYIVMELIRGRTLRDIIHSQGALEPRTAFYYTSGVLKALAYSHRAGIVHRDIKPANVMLTDDGVIKVMDFGIARAVSDTSATMTQTAAIIGTAQYLSPEQARGEVVDNRSDLYSTGCLLYELLTGRPPFVGDSPVSVAYQHVRETPELPSKLVPSITSDMDAVVMKALAKDPKDRYQTADLFYDDIIRILNGQGVTATLPATAATQVIDAPTQAYPATATGPTRALPAEEDPDTFADQPQQPEKKKRRPGPVTWVLIALLVILLGMIGFFAWRLTAPAPEPTTVKVPQLVGTQRDHAQQLLQDAQLTAEINEKNDPKIPAGQVIAQDPQEGTEVVVGSTVKITVSIGPELLKLPNNLIGMKVADAENALRQAGFTNITTQAPEPGTNTSNQAPGTVIKVDPSSGKFPADHKITLTVTPKNAEMPYVKDLTADAAEDVLKNAGFTNIRRQPGSVTQDNRKKDRVEEQYPSPGQLIDLGSEIMLAVYQYQEPQPTPAPTVQAPDQNNQQPAPSTPAPSTPR